ncbi:uncharacterized protein LOC121751889 [Salvia splendens]|uniref:uncharacterized protein LOC121751889 n=1 Tax=Salvia splendens TaxID=180675 RepID=UPI001C25F71F|nr:uncharacterized protein LOC121751889 [Salvia splendens]
MALDSSTSVLNSLLEKLRLDDPCVPPRSWDSISSQGGASSHPPPPSSAALYATSTVSDPSLVRLAMNALEGVESALISIEKLSALLCCSSADRTSHRNPSLWSRSSSTVAIGNILISIGQFGCMIFLLRRFVDYFTNPDFDGVRDLKEKPNADSGEEGNSILHGFTLINHAFAISVGKVIDGYISALNTLSASVSLRRFLKTKDGGCLTNIGHSEMTLLGVYLHTAELRTQMEALGNLCNVDHLTDNFPVSSLEVLRAKPNSEFSAFPRSGSLLSFLYIQLKVADPGHCPLLKFLFLQSYEPYCEFIRSWIYDGSISDPYNEFVVECASNASGGSSSPLPTIRVRDEVAVPCFLHECLIPLCRTGQQLQVIMKLLDLSNDVGTCFCHEKILPRLVGLANEYPGSFPLIFDKEAIEEMVHVRASYHQQLLEKVDSILDKLDFSSRQTAHLGVSLSLANNLKSQNHQAYSATEESSISSLSDKKNQNVHGVMVDTDVPSINHECSHDEDLLESSECSSSYESSEEQDEAEPSISLSYTPETNYLSALDFSSTLSTNNRIQTLQNQVSSREYDNCQFNGHHIDRVEHDQLHSPDCGAEISMENHGWLNTDFDFSELSINNTVASKDQHPLITKASSKTTSLQLSKLKYDSTFFSMNPILNRCSFFSPRSILGERGHENYTSIDFDFTSVKFPVDTYAVKLASATRIGNEVRDINKTPVSTIYMRNHLDVECHNDNMVGDKVKLSSVGLSLPLHNCGNEENLWSPNVSGGSAWESLLGRSRNTGNRSNSDRKMKLVAGADMPLDFVIKKCVLDEISLQYTYISRLTIKMLIEGFKLQEHLQSLRCYHFMELADWADLFITSLWNCKWHVDEVDKRIPEIQGILEQALRRSSCEKDPNKNRLYVYLKGDGIRYLSPSAIGIRSFDYLGLGYQIDWPVSIILTPAALKLYSDLFNFLIQVKLAVFALSDVWCLLKGYDFKQQAARSQQFSELTETRHKINHFVSTLQQYVLSQLSQVSWFRFIHSLKHKVKDMLDLESVHMGYLTESLHICFLSNETQSIAGIIQNILQCAMDFRSCLAAINVGAAADDENFPHKISQIDISQVQVIRRAFTKSLEDLYLIYLQSPKHGEFGISYFWDLLDSNEYYAGVMNKRMGHCIFFS